MAKVSKTNLKNAVRECLIEILEEGLSGQKDTNERKSLMRENTNRSLRKKANVEKRSSVYDKMTYASPSPEDQLERIAESARQMTDDPILSGIFADTAKTTLQEQVQAESGKGSIASGRGDRAAVESLKSDPSELFGSDVANKWASLAFADPAKK